MRGSWGVTTAAPTAEGSRERWRQRRLGRAGNNGRVAGRGVCLGGLGQQKVGLPALALIDGNPELHEALREQWPNLPIQRCTARKLRNLLAKVPASLREEVAEDYHPHDLR